MKITLTSVWGESLFEHEQAGNTVKDTVLLAAAQGVDLRTVNLKEAKLEQADLSGIDFTGADLTGADLFYAKCVEAKFDGAILAHANLLGADLTRASFEKSYLDGARLGATIKDTNFKGARLRGVDLQTSSLVQFVGFGPFEGCLTYDWANNKILNEGDGFYGSFEAFKKHIAASYPSDTHKFRIEYEAILGLIAKVYRIEN